MFIQRFFKGLKSFFHFIASSPLFLITFSVAIMSLLAYFVSLGSQLYFTRNTFNLIESDTNGQTEPLYLTNDQLNAINTNLEASIFSGISSIFLAVIYLMMSYGAKEKITDKLKENYINLPNEKTNLLSLDECVPLNDNDKLNKIKPFQDPTRVTSLLSMFFAMIGVSLVFASTFGLYVLHDTLPETADNPVNLSGANDILRDNTILAGVGAGALLFSGLSSLGSIVTAIRDKSVGLLKEEEVKEEEQRSLALQ